jgi:hypothetical protein
MKTQSFIGLILIMIAAGVSCKKKEKTPREILTDGSWSLYKQREYDDSGNFTGEINMNVYVEFYDDGSCTFAGMEYGYIFLDDENPMKIIIDGDSFIVLKLEAREMVWKENKINGYNKLYFKR